MASTGKRSGPDDDERSRPTKRAAHPPVLRCSLLCCPCPERTIETGSARVRIRVKPTEAERIASFRSLASRARVSYGRDGVADFHRGCFRAVSSAVGGDSSADRGRRRDDDGSVDAAERIGAVGGIGRAEARALLGAASAAEMWDSDVELREKAEAVCDAMRGVDGRSKPCVVVFTGAGISTSAGIGDYRGLRGKWTEDEMGLSSAGNDDGGSGDDVVPYEDLRPTLAHEAISRLVADGTVEYVISQNCDGLHTLSGVPDAKLSELHGNVFREYCEDCGAEYDRARYVPRDDADGYYAELSELGATDRPKPRGTARCERCGLNHRTGRRCAGCGGPLCDTIINFGDVLRPRMWDPAREHAGKADVCLALGSTLSVTPASELVTNKTGKLIIVNRQRTECDDDASIIVRGDADNFMREIMVRLLGGKEGLRAFLSWREAKRAGYDLKRGEM